VKQGDCSAGSSWSAAAGALLLSEIVYEVSYYLKGRDTVSCSFVVETADLAEMLAVAYAECVHIVGRHDLALLPVFGSRFAVVTSRQCVGTVGFRRIGATCRTSAGCV